MELFLIGRDNNGLTSITGNFCKKYLKNSSAKIQKTRYLLNIHMGLTLGKAFLSKKYNPTPESTNMANI